MSPSRPSQSQSARIIDEQIEITVGDIQYLLIPNEENFLRDTSLEGDTRALVLVYTTTAGQTISRSALRAFRADILDCDDVFQPEFFCNLVFYGATKADTHIEPGALDELAIWDVKTHTFIVSKSAAQTAPGPYISARGKTWQPWRIYYDFNACLMTALKPSSNTPKR